MPQWKSPFQYPLKFCIWERNLKMLSYIYHIDTRKRNASYFPISQKKHFILILKGGSRSRSPSYKIGAEQKEDFYHFRSSDQNNKLIITVWQKNNYFRLNYRIFPKNSVHWKNLFLWNKMYMNHAEQNIQYFEESPQQIKYHRALFTC